MPRKAATRRATTKIQERFHPVFGPVADPAPHFGLGHIDPGAWLPRPWPWPIPDPAPPFAVGGWRQSLAAQVDRQQLDPESVKQLTALRARRVAASIVALEQEAKILDAEWATLQKLGPKLTFPGPVGPVGPGDPAPEIKPVDFLRFAYEARSAALTHTIGFLRQMQAAIEGAR